jgi:hypothetical protein
VERVDRRGAGVAGLLVAALAIVCGAPASADERHEQDALRRALKLTAVEKAVKVVLIDPELAPDPGAIAGLDAFIVREDDRALRQVIYVNRRSEIVMQAASGSDFYVTVLAAVIHHEAQHLRGASEAEARCAETAFFRALIDRGEVPSRLGEQYLRLLGQRQD